MEQKKLKVKLLLTLNLHNSFKMHLVCDYVYFGSFLIEKFMGTKFAYYIVSLKNRKGKKLIKKNVFIKPFEI